MAKLFFEAKVTQKRGKVHSLKFSEKVVGELQSEKKKHQQPLKRKKKHIALRSVVTSVSTQLEKKKDFPRDFCSLLLNQNVVYSISLFFFFLFFSTDCFFFFSLLLQDEGKLKLCF